MSFENVPNDTTTPNEVFKYYPGPVLMLDSGAGLTPVNAAGRTVSDAIVEDADNGVLPGLIQMADKADSERRAVTRTFTLPQSESQIEFILLPQPNGSHLVIGRDTTFEDNVRSALTQSRTRFRDLVDVAADFAWETDENGVFSYISPSGAVGYQPDDLLGLHASSIVLSPDTAPNPLPFLAKATVHNVELWVRDRAGAAACLLISSMPLQDGDHIGRGARGIAVDVTEDRKQQSELARLKLRDHLVAHIVDALRSAITPTEMLQAAATALGQATSSDSCVVQVFSGSGDPVEIAGYGEPLIPEQIETVAAAVSENAPPVDGTIGEYRYLALATAYQGARNGSIILSRAQPSVGWDDEDRDLLIAVEPQFGIVFRQISDQVSLEQLSRTDVLTGLRNRRAFVDDFNREMVRYERYHDGGALLFLDLDNFKKINDQLGHAKGDEALKAVADILTTHTRTYDLVCRLGGDEFAVLIEGANREIAQARGQIFLDALQEWSSENLDPEIGFGMSIGIAIFEPDTGLTFEGLIVSADAAMYKAKHSGKNQIFFAPSQSDASDSRTMAKPAKAKPAETSPHTTPSRRRTHGKPSSA